MSEGGELGRARGGRAQRRAVTGPGGALANRVLDSHKLMICSRDRDERWWQTSKRANSTAPCAAQRVASGGRGRGVVEEEERDADEVR